MNDHRMNEHITPAYKFDTISHPAHYCAGRKYEPKDVIRDWNLNFNLGSAVKYLSRAGRKENNSKEQDLQKAIQYIRFELEAMQAQKAVEPKKTEEKPHENEHSEDAPDNLSEDVADFITTLGEAFFDALTDVFSDVLTDVFSDEETENDKG